MPVLEVVTHVNAPPDRVFDLARDVGLHLRSLAGTGERVVGGRSEGLLEPGETVTWRAWHLGVPWRMTVRITEFERPRRFQDRMVRGPFRSFSHDHHFEAAARGTRMYDVIAYRAPLGVLGRAAEFLVLHRRLRRVLEARCAAIRAAAEAGPDPIVGS